MADILSWSANDAGSSRTFQWHLIVLTNDSTAPNVSPGNILTLLDSKILNFTEKNFEMKKETFDRNFTFVKKVLLEIYRFRFCWVDHIKRLKRVPVKTPDNNNNNNSNNDDNSNFNDDNYDDDGNMTSKSSSRSNNNRKLFFFCEISAGWCAGRRGKNRPII